MKLSRYNYYTKNKDDEILMFNTMKGPSSFLKIPVEIANVAENVLSGKAELGILPISLYTEFVNNNYIISDEIDEESQLKKVYIDQIADTQLRLTIIPTEQCNFRCKYCYESFPNNTMDITVQNSILLFLKKNLHKYSSLHISWFGGEPLLSLDTIEYLTNEIKKICSFYKKTYTASITTNGFLLNLQNFKRLLKCNVVYYQITIDGIKEIHDRQRPHYNLEISTYDAIINNLRNIKENIKSNTFRITLRSNFAKDHLEVINRYKHELGDQFEKDIRFQFFVRPVMDWGGECIEQFKDNLLTPRLLDDIYDSIIKSDRKLTFIYDDFLYNGGGVCEAGKRNSYVIVTNGDIYKCTCNFEEQPNAKIGKLLADGTMSINANDEIRWLCNDNYCERKCFYAPICLGEACPAIRVMNKTRQEQCPLEKKSLSKILQILDEENKLFRRVDYDIIH